MHEFLKDLGIMDVNRGATTGSTGGWLKTGGRELVSVSPVDGKPIASIVQATEADYRKLVASASGAFKKWRMTPAPKRGEVIREIGEELRRYKEPLGKLITLEMGKILPESLGEVQEAIDTTDFAVGLSRQLYGLTMQSERNRHRMYEQWHPLGIVGVITAFNFPVAVWSWNFLIAAVCGNAVIWKPSSKSPLCAIALHNIIAPVVDRHRLDGLFSLVIGSGKEIGELMINQRELPLISSTGSCKMGRRVGEAVAARLGRSLLELGGNNAIIVTEDADIDLAVRATLFGAVGTAGQRCTTTRRIILNRKIAEKYTDMLVKSYKQIRIGNPLEEGILMGPLVDRDAVDTMMRILPIIKEQGGEIIYGGGEVEVPGCNSSCYVEPVIVRAKRDMPILQEETFAPILYLLEYETIEEAIEIQNGVSQGLSSAIFTGSLKYSEKFLSPEGSDCGIANVNIGTSGAEIGGAFGGEKDTGGGRESGSDSWKSYMRRQTNTINWGDELPLAQGIKFEV
jgi:aldehyde dehydrogenase (NAD+)